MLDKLRTQLVRQGPALLRLPISMMPFALKQRVIEQVLHWQFRQALAEGELDFLNGRWLKIEVNDLDLTWFMTVIDDRLSVKNEGIADVSFIGNANDLVLIAARKEDPDTLFFQRRLTIEGDTELGLQVKNLMDAIDLESMPKALRITLLQLAAFIAAGVKEGAPVKATRASLPC